MLEEEMRKIDECDMEEFDTPDSSENAIAILGDRWWPQAAKQEGDKISNKFLCSIRKQRNERPNIGGASTRRTVLRPERDACVVNGPMTKQQMKEEGTEGGGTTDPRRWRGDGAWMQLRI